ncbi:hypothetical protein ACRAWD_08475 [Caulobacter segnis]
MAESLADAASRQTQRPGVELSSTHLTFEAIGLAHEAAATKAVSQAGRNLVGGFDLFDLPLVQDRHPVGQVSKCLFLVVGYEDGGHAR